MDKTNSESINERVLHINSKANIDNSLLMGHDYTMMATINVRSKTLSDNDDGTANMTYKAKMITAEILDDKGNHVSKARGKGSMSQKWKWAIDQRGLDYEKFMDKTLSHQDEVLDYIEKL